LSSATIRTKTPRHKGNKDFNILLFSTFLFSSLCAFVLSPASAQVESVENTSPSKFVWVSRARIEGHLALEYSPAGAFSPNSTQLAVVNEDKVVLLGLREGVVQKILKPRIPEITDLNIQSANFFPRNQLLLLATGLIRAKGKSGQTPLLAFLWNAFEDDLSSKVNAIGAGGGFGRPRFFPELGYLCLYKNSNFDLWSPLESRMIRIHVPPLTQQPRIYAFSRDAKWLLLGQIEMSSSPDPVVVRLSDKQFVDALRGHQGTLLSLAFSRDGAKVVTACEDAKIRLFSASDWKLLTTLAGHQGPVHWADFSPDGNWVASAGEDSTVRIWSAEDGKLVQTLDEMKAPVLTVAFSPDGEYVAASSEKAVQVWQRTRAN
jgi:WD40 repeat protein